MTSESLRESFPQLWGYNLLPPHSVFIHGFWRSTSGPHACMANTLKSEPPPPTQSLMSSVDSDFSCLVIQLDFATLWDLLSSTSFFPPFSTP